MHVEQTVGQDALRSARWRKRCSVSRRIRGQSVSLTVGRVAAALTRLAVALARPVPLSVLGAVGAALGWTWYRCLPIRRGVARDNVRRALGRSDDECEAVVRAMYLHLGRSAFELLALPRVAATLVMEGREHVDEALAVGRGVVLLTAHLGNWEVLVHAARGFGPPVTVLTKRMSAGWAESAWRALRRGGATLLHERGTGHRVRGALARGEVVAFVLDQHEPSRGALRAPFMGRMAATSTGLARLALATGAPVVPVFTHRAPAGHHVVVFGPPMPRPEAGGSEGAAWLTRACLAAVERAIRAHPEQWLWIHRRWKAELSEPAGASPAARGRRRAQARAPAPVATPPEPPRGAPTEPPRRPG